MVNDKLFKGLQWAGAIGGVVITGIQIANLIDEKKHGAERHQRDLDYISDRMSAQIAPQVSDGIVNYLSQMPKQ